MATASTLASNNTAIAEDVDDELARQVAASPEAKQLRARPEILEFRSVLQIRKEFLPQNLTGTTLNGTGKIESPPIVFADHDRGFLVAFYHLGTSLQGHSGILHGGMAAVLLDEVMGRACFPLLVNKIAVTANLNINYRAPMPLPGFFVVRGMTKSIERNKAKLEGRIEDFDGKVFVEADALFIDPKFGNSLSKMM